MQNKDFGFRIIITDYPNGLFAIHSEDDYLDNYDEALKVKKAGDLHKAAEMLKISCEPPSIYKGHYRELFKIFRILNKQDLRDGNYQQVIDRVNLALRYDSEMIDKLCQHWGKVHNVEYGREYFACESNILISDLKALLKASLAMNDLANTQKAQNMINNWYINKNAL